MKNPDDIDTVVINNTATAPSTDIKMPDILPTQAEEPEIAINAVASTSLPPPITSAAVSIQSSPIPKAESPNKPPKTGKADSKKHDGKKQEKEQINSTRQPPKVTGLKPEAESTIEVGLNYINASQTSDLLFHKPDEIENKVNIR